MAAKMTEGYRKYGTLRLRGVGLIEGHDDKCISMYFILYNTHPSSKSHGTFRVTFVNSQCHVAEMSSLADHRMSESAGIPAPPSH